MQLSQYYEVSQAADVASLESRLIACAAELEFERVNAVLVIEGASTREVPTFISIGNTPKSFLEASRNPADSARDPVNRRLKSMSVPVVYDQALYATEGAGDLWELQAAFGYKTGAAVALHLPQFRHFLLGVDRDSALPRDEMRLTRMLADLQLLAVHAQHAASQLLAPEEPAMPDTPELTAREVEILRWTMEGKTAWAVGSILSISEATVNFHLRNVFRKLGASSKHQAVLKALKMRLI